MDQEKIGKLIAKLRKEKKLTQEQLGQKMGVNSKAVSKWECGLTTPDISIVNKLAEELGITTKELLSGKQEFTSTKNLNNKNIFNFIKKNIFIIIIISTLLIINICLFSFVYNNYNKYGYTKFVLNNDSFYSEGYLITQKNKKLVFLKNLIYQSDDKGTNDELKISKIKISILNDNEIILNYTFDEQYDEAGNIKNYYISDLLENFSIIFSENKKATKINELNDENLILLLEYNTSDNIKEKKEYKLSIIDKEYNNNLFK